MQEKVQMLSPAYATQDTMVLEFRVQSALLATTQAQVDFIHKQMERI